MTSLGAETVPVPIVLLSLGVGPLSYQRIIRGLIFGLYYLNSLCYTTYLFDLITYWNVSKA